MGVAGWWNNTRELLEGKNRVIDNLQFDKNIHTDILSINIKQSYSVSWG